MDYEHSKLGTGLRWTQHYVRGKTPRITESVCMMRKTFLTSALDMPEIMSYIYNKSWKLQFSASSSIIIIEDFYLQTFLHSLVIIRITYLHQKKFIKLSHPHHPISHSITLCVVSQLEFPLATWAKPLPQILYNTYLH